MQRGAYIAFPIFLVRVDTPAAVSMVALAVHLTVCVYVCVQAGKEHWHLPHECMYGSAAVWILDGNSFNLG